MAVAFVMVVTVVSLGESTAEAFGTFWDDDGSSHESNIEAIAAAGITNGCGNGQYCPGDSVTRGQMASFLVRGLSLSATDGTTFNDIAGHPHQFDIEKLAAAGVTNGCGDGAFCPNDSVSRAEMATFLARGLGLAPVDSNTFSDDDGMSHEPNIEAIAAAGITNGCGNGQYCPWGAVTRAQMASFLARALGLDPISPVPVGFPTTDDEALVERYHVLDRRDDGVRISVNDMQYWPRSFQPGLDIDPDRDADDVQIVDSTGPYAGWDALSPSTDWKYKNLYPDNVWMNLNLNRAARVGVVWRGDLPLPSWLGGWAQGGSVGIDGKFYPVYEKDFPAGPVALGSVEATDRWREMYLVLLAESDGTPTSQPPVPPGFAIPIPSQVCPDWVHGRFTTTGPDGNTYNTWHPQIDPVYWCSFGHEHGSDPALIPGAPLVPYGYVAAHVPQDEPDVGFKEFTFQDDSGEYWVRFVVHSGTASARRVCARHHTLYVQVYDSSGNEKFNANFKADYGFAEATGDAGGGVLQPSNCGYSMQTLADQVSDRNRSINVGAESNNYERWDSRSDTEQTRNLGLAQFDHSFDIRNPMSHCVNMTCDSVVVRDPDRENATRRTLGMATWKSNFLFGAGTALGSGEYYTDVFGSYVLPASDPGAVRQYVEPGFSLGFFKNSTANRIECVASDPWAFDYSCYQIGGAGNLEHLPHVPDMNIEHSLTRN